MSRGLFDGDIIVSCREWLHGRGVMADAIPDAEVVPRVQIILVSLCGLYPGTGEKRFARDMRTYPEDTRLTPKQLEWIAGLWLKYRGQLRRFDQYEWPMGLPRPPKDKPKRTASEGRTP